MKIFEYNKLLFAAIVVTVCSGVAFIWSIAIDLDKTAKINFITQADIVANAINIEHLQSLTATEADLSKRNYSLLKQQLYNIRTSNEDYKFLYILGHDRATSTVFFYIDSQMIDSEDYAPPGLVYDEVADDFRQAILSENKTFVGPVTDRWGTLVTALIPLRDPQTNKVIATLGMDIQADDWHTNLFRLSVLPVGLTLLTMALIVLAIFLKVKSNELKKSVTQDSLTKLYSRKIILELAESQLCHCLQHRSSFSIIVLDIDDFKQVNDKYGHLVGDTVLKMVAACMAKTLRETDMAGRIGGEEFLVLLPFTDEKGALEVAEKMRRCICELQFDAQQCQGMTHVSASFGISATSDHAESFEKLYEFADKALYLSKNAGKNKVSVLLD